MHKTRLGGLPNSLFYISTTDTMQITCQQVPLRHAIEKMEVATRLIVLTLLLTLGIGSSSAHSHGQTSLSYRYSGASGPLQIMAELVSPERAISCAPEADPCVITLNVTLMQTMTLYEHLEDGQRAAEGYPAAWDVGTEPAQLRMAPDSPLPDRAVAQFLYPVVGDGMKRRAVFAVNNQVPGPVIVGYKGQSVQIRVINSLPSYNITIHWHGQHVRGTPWVDGAVYVTQCPIEPGEELVYRFSLDQVGTHLYHAHNAGERTDGIHGGLVVKDTPSAANDTLVDTPEEHTMVVTDWYHETWDVLLEKFENNTFLDPVNSSVIYSPTPISDGTLSSHYPFVSGLINGVGRLFYPHASNCTPETKVPLQEFNVTADNEYRFRMIGVQSWFALRLSIQGHRLRLIATDGVDVTTNHITAEVDYIIINSGERYDFVPVPTEASPTGKYWIVMETLEKADELEARSYCIAGHRAYAILTYDSTLRGDPTTAYDPLNRGCTMENKCYAVNCPFAAYPHSYNISCLNVEQLRLMEPEAVTDNDLDADLLFLNFQVVSGHVNRNAINGRHYLTPQVPLLTANISDLDTCDAPTSHLHEKRGTECIHRYDFQSNITDMVFMTLGNSASDGHGHGHGHGGATTGGHNDGGHGSGSVLHIHGHPVHLHGHYFRVLKIGYPTYMHGTYSADNMDVNCTADPYCEKGAAWQVKPNVTLDMMLPKKDTIFVPAGGYVIARVARNNPGIWQLHCHIAPHHVQGMTMVIDESELFNRSHVPPTWPLCSPAPLGSSGSSNVFYSKLFLLVMASLAAFLLDAP